MRISLPVLLITGFMTLALITLTACGGKQPAGKVFFLDSQDGAEVVSPFRVRMGVEGLIVEPADGIRAGSGHHHILIDVASTPLDQEIPKDVRHLHFGKGQTEAILDLEPGQHTLKLVFANGTHIPYNPPITDTITITVTK